MKCGYNWKIQGGATLLVLFLLAPCSAHAYIGPGAGFAFLGSTFVFIVTLGMALLTISLWPLQFAWRKIRGKGISKKARTRRIVIVGLDGLEPKLVDQYMSEGRLPNMKKLAEEGSYQRLGTTLPALSPVAWSTFQTGVNPGAHNIFDFLTRDKRHCLPKLASTEIDEAPAKKGLLSKLAFWRKQTMVRITRKSQPFWKVLGKHGVFSNIIRVPISYPPEKFNGNILSAMCTPDLRGTQGSFTLFQGVKKDDSTNTIGGEVQTLELRGNSYHGRVAGPPNPRAKNDKDEKFITTDFSLEPNASGDGATLIVEKTKHALTLNEFSPWIELNFYIGRKPVSGIARFCLRSLTPEISLYVSPVNIHPEKPALPIAHPIFFSSWFAKRQGPYGTLGLMEDTWGRNEFALDDKRFLEQTYLTHDEREVMFFDALERSKEGMCICVFDASDRIQHMFWRYIDDNHPSPREADPELKNAIPDMYDKMDGLVGRVREKLKPEDVLVVLSDHGFSSFRRCVNINTWLMENGYLTLKDGKTIGADYLQDVDWSKTRAFALGLSGLYINRKGREARGIVSPADADKLKAEISAGLEKLTDPQDGTRAVRKMYDTAKAYRGIYTDEAPDLIVGYEPGYRVSWDCVTGTVEQDIFSDNLKAWSGDHHVDPKAVPGVLFTNRKLKVQDPHIADIAPTALDLFAVPVPRYMEGRVLI